MSTHLVSGIIVGVAFVLIVHLEAVSQDEPVRYEFSGNTLEENSITIQGAGFDSYPRGTVSFGEIPSSLRDRLFPKATDGRGMIIDCAPGQGVMVFTQPVQSQGALLIQCSIHATSPNHSIILATIDLGPNTFVASNTANNGAYPLNQYRRLALLSIPSTDTIQPLIQVLNTGETDPLTVYIDNFEIFALSNDRFYSGNFLNGDEQDAALVSISNEIPQPTPTLPQAPSPTPAPPTPTNQPTPSPTLGFFGFMLVTGTITNSADGTGIVGAKIYLDGFPETQSESFFGGGYILSANLFNTNPPYTLVVEAEGFHRYEKVFTAENLSGSVFLNIALVPDQNAPPTATPTSFAVFPTPTATSVPSGSAVGLRLTACYPYGGSRNPRGVNVFVDLIDAQGRIVNPGVEGGDANRTVTVSVTGSAGFSDNPQNRSKDVFVNNPFGGTVTIFDQTSETVTVSATSPNLNAAEPITVQFIPTGGISGQLRVWDGEKYINPSIAFTLDVDVLSVDSDYTFSPTFVYNGRDGRYQVFGLAAGTYSLRFNPKENLDIPIQGDPLGENLAWVCANNVVVNANQLTPLDIDLGPREPGARIAGTVVRADGKPIRTATLYLVSLEYPNLACNSRFYTETFYNIIGDPVLEANFEFLNVPPGTYRLYAFDIDYDNQLAKTIYLHNEINETITVSAGGNEDVVVVLDQGTTITPVAPVDFARTSITPLFEWELSGNDLTDLRLSIIDRCGEMLYTQPVSGTQTRYRNTNLSNQTWYTWNVLPNDFPNFFVGLFTPTKGVPFFLVDGADSGPLRR